MDRNFVYWLSRTDASGFQAARRSPASMACETIGTWQHLRRLFCVSLLCLLSGVTFVSVAQASEIKWYWPQGGTENCWQTGTVGAESAACDQVGANFLSAPGGHPPGFAHLVDFLNYAGAETPELSPSGDYCNYYSIGDYIDQGEPSDQSKYTGLLTAQPFSSFQESDGHQNTCVAEGPYWGQELRSNAPESGCYHKCGTSMEVGSSPVVVREEGKEGSRQAQWIYYHGSNGHLALEAWTGGSSGKWTNEDLGVSMG